jgi:glycosyltransferase involved in cell wall biosynthesis
MTVPAAARPPLPERGGHRVLMVIDHLDMGGAQRHVTLLATALVERGHEVHVLHTGPPIVHLDPRVQVRRLLAERVARREEPYLEALVMRYAMEVRPTVMHAHLFASALASARTAHRLQAPLVISHHSAGTWQEAEDRQVLRQALDQASYHFTASPQIRAFLLEQGLPARLVEFLPNAIRVPQRPPDRSLRGALQVGFLGRFDVDKDPVLAVEALAQAHALGSRARLEMRGGGPLAADVRQAVTDRGLAGHVKVAGFVRDVEKFYRRIDVLLLSSRSEGMPLVVLEAMGHELPVVATRVGAVPLEVADGMTGLLAESGDAGGLGEALAWLEAHPAERLRMGRQGRRRLQRHFSLDRMTGRVSRVYERVARLQATRAG